MEWPLPVNSQKGFSVKADAWLVWGWWETLKIAQLWNDWSALFFYIVYKYTRQLSLPSPVPFLATVSYLFTCSLSLSHRASFMFTYDVSDIVVNTLLKLVLWRQVS